LLEEAGGSPVETKSQRRLYIDNLRLLMIVLVVIQHLAVTYSGFGSWYYKEGRPLVFPSDLLFGFWESLTQGYFMGILFLIAGYFAPRSYDRKGFGKFVKDRFVRLMIPALLYMLAIHPFIEYVELGLSWIRPKPSLLAYYAGGLETLGFLGATGPLWFAVALFIFSVVYGLVRLLTGGSAPSTRRVRIRPTVRNAALLILLISLFTFLMRIVQPIGTSILNMQLAYFAQYVVLFVVGILAYRSELFVQFDYSWGKKWLTYGLILGFVSWVALTLAGGAPKSLTAFGGGITWQSAGFSLWESAVAVAVDIGLISLFKDRFNRQSRLVKALSDNAFAVYVFHAPLIIAVSLWFRPVMMPPILKWVMLSVICIPLCFAFAHFVVRRLPLLKEVM
jgi:peptidoglycan/LPS O-acetylase OafA/YrhL